MADDLMRGFFGESAAIVAVRRQVEHLLSRQAIGRPLPPILILGEPGTGKTLLARLIHSAGPRASGPFVDVNCPGIPETLLESEMFGFERGAFTDARQAKAGLFQAANHGTIFLDEIGVLPVELQAKLLKVIEERSLRRLGSTRSEPVDVAIVTATNENLVAATRERRFREDLYHRLAVLTIELPPLRERANDITLLAERLLARACAEHSLPRKTLDSTALAALCGYRWPGNIRELGNVLERVALLHDAPVVTAQTLRSSSPALAAPALPAAGLPVASPEAGQDSDRERLRQALERVGWNTSRAASLLGLSRNTLRYRMEKYGLRPGTSAPPVRRPAAPAPAPVAVAIAPAPATIAPAPVATAPTQGRAAAAPGPSAPTRLRWDRRRVTLLHAALVPAAMEDATPHASRLAEMLVDKVQSFGGRVEELGPTGIVASFGLEWPEDAPRHAAHAAMAIQNAAARVRQDGPSPHLKAGIHVGQFLIGESGGAAQIDLETKREAMLLLRSLLAEASADVVLVTEAAAPFVERSFDLEPLESSGSGAGGVFRLAGRPFGVPGFGRPMAPFVGRRHELELLEGRLTSTVAGRGQLIGVVGDAGLGKSRLVFEFRRALARRDITWLEGRCVSYGASMPFLPILQMLRSNFGISDVQDTETVSERVRAGLEAIRMDADEWAPYLFQLLGVRVGTERLAGLAPEAVRLRMLEAIRQLALQGSQRRPIVLVLEDLHWIDKTSEEVVNALVESLAGARIMFIATYRPGYRPPWMDKSYATQIAIQPLSEDESRAVMRAALRTKEVPDALARQILEKAEGNPFFLEELAGTVRDQSDLGPTLEAPDTVQEVLLARIHRLPEEPKQALQLTALLGRESSLKVLRSLWSGPDDVESHLRELVRLEFLYAHSQGVEPVYVFKHPLTQEVSYASLPAPQRQRLHAAAGRALEAIHADRLPDVYEQLAHHYGRSDRHDKALEYLMLFAQKTASLHAHEEAVEVLEEALRHLQALPTGDRDRRRLDLVLFQTSELIPLGRLQEILELLLPQREFVERLDDPALSGRYHFVLAYAYSFLDRERSAWHAERAIVEADRCGDIIVKGNAHCILGQDGPFSGRATEGIAHGRKAIELLESSGSEHWWRGRAHWIVALNYCQTGAFDEALDEIAIAGRIGESTGDPRMRTCAAWCTGIVHTARGDFDASITACRRGVDLAPDPLNRAFATGWLGYALMEKGESGEAIACLDPVTKMLGKLGYRPLQGWFAAFLAEAYRLEGQLDLARDVARKSLQIATDAQVRVAEGWARLALGRIAIDAGAHAEAEEHLGGAQASFEAVHSRYELARARMDLAVATHALGKKAETQTLLSSAHALFEEVKVPYHSRRAESLAHDLGVSLSRQ